MNNSDFIQEQKLNSWPEPLSFMTEGILKAEPKAKESVIRMDDGTVKRRRLSTPDLYTSSFTLNANQYDLLMGFFRANSGYAFACRDAEGTDVVVAFAAEPQVKRHSFTIDQPTMGERECEITLKKIR